MLLPGAVAFRNFPPYAGAKTFEFRSTPIGRRQLGEIAFNRINGLHTFIKRRNCLEELKFSLVELAVSSLFARFLHVPYALALNCESLCIFLSIMHFSTPKLALGSAFALVLILTIAGKFFLWIHPCRTWCCGLADPRLGDRPHPQRTPRLKKTSPNAVFPRFASLRVQRHSIPYSGAVWWKPPMRSS